MKFQPNLAKFLAVGSVAAIALTGCAPAQTGASAGGAGKPLTMSFVPGVAGDEFYITMQCGIEAEAKKLGVTVNTQGPTKFDPTLQKPIVDSVVAAKPDGILIAPTDVTAMGAPLKAAAAAGIKVGLVDTTLQDTSFVTTQVASDNKGGGAAAFKAIQEANPTGGKVLAISVDPGISTIDARIEGFENAVKADSKFTYVGVQYSHNDPAVAAQLVSAALSKDPDIIGIFAANIFSAEGSATGARQVGKQPGLTIVGFDAGPAQIKQLKEGTVQALIAQQPWQIGANGLDQVVAAMKGEPVTKSIQTDSKILTKDNLAADEAKYAYKSGC
jgi:ribose transport system substrate-binding protein